MPANPGAYDRRIAELRRQLDSHPPNALRQVYEQAIQLTNDSMYLLESLLECTEKKFKNDQQNIDERIRWHTERLNRYATEIREAGQSIAIGKGGFEHLAAHLKIKTILVMLNTDVSIENTKIQQLWSYLGASVATELGNKLFDEIFWPDERSFQYAAVVTGLEKLAGAIPIYGTIYSGLKAAYGIVTARQARTQTAHAHGHYYEDYCDALRLWGIAAEAAIRSCELFED